MATPIHTGEGTRHGDIDPASTPRETTHTHDPETEKGSGQVVIAKRPGVPKLWVGWPAGSGPEPGLSKGKGDTSRSWAAS